MNFCTRKFYIWD